MPIVFNFKVRDTDYWVPLLPDFLLYSFFQLNQLKKKGGRIEKIK